MSITQIPYLFFCITHRSPKAIFACLPRGGNGLLSFKKGENLNFFFIHVIKRRMNSDYCFALLLYPNSEANLQDKSILELLTQHSKIGRKFYR